MYHMNVRESFISWPYLIGLVVNICSTKYCRFFFSSAKFVRTWQGIWYMHYSTDTLTIRYALEKTEIYTLLLNHILDMKFCSCEDFSKLYARIYFYREHFVLMKLWYKNNNTWISSRTLLFRQRLLLKE